MCLERTKGFHFFTLVTKDDQYQAMRESLAGVGFDESNSVFTVLDNRGGRNVHEPYSAITRAVREAEAPYVVFCHQDLVFYLGPGALMEAIRGVEAKDPNWAVIGNAGGMPDLDCALCIDHTDKSYVTSDLPSRVLTLDENFLVIRRDSGVGCSPGMAGFHLYGADLCLNAYQMGFSAWVVDYRLLHLGTTLDYEGLHRLARRFYRIWRDRLRGAVLITPAAAIVFSRVPFLFAAVNRTGVRDRLVQRFVLIRTLDYLLRHGRPDWLPMARYAPDDPRGPRLGRAMRTLDAALRRGSPVWSPTARYEEYDAANLERHWSRIAALQRQQETEAREA